jgi:hypothetical protein
VVRDDLKTIEEYAPHLLDLLARVRSAGLDRGHKVWVAMPATPIEGPAICSWQDLPVFYAGDISQPCLCLEARDE